MITNGPASPVSPVGTGAVPACAEPADAVRWGTRRCRTERAWDSGPAPAIRHPGRDGCARGPATPGWARVHRPSRHGFGPVTDSRKQIDPWFDAYADAIRVAVVLPSSGRRITDSGGSGHLGRLLRVDAHPAPLR